MDIAYSVHAPTNKTLAGSYFIIFALTKYRCSLTVKTPLPAVCEHSYVTWALLQAYWQFSEQSMWLSSLPSMKETVLSSPLVVQLEHLPFHSCEPSASTFYIHEFDIDVVSQ